MNLSKTKTKKGALFAVCILTLLFLSLGSVLMAGADDMPVWNGDDVQARYTSNRMLVLPKKTVTVGGKTETASAVVRFPDGTAKKIDSLFLEQTGAYTVSYTANVGCRLYSESKEFRVVSANVLTGANSTAAWRYSEKYADEGLMIGLAQGETVTFANTIDVASLTSATAGITPLLELYVAPENIGSTDFRRLYVTFTDSSDPTQTVTVLLGEYADGRSETMLSASPKGQTYTSWEWYSGNMFRGEDSWHAHANSSFGAAYGANGYAQKDRPIRLWYESDTRQIFYDTLDTSDITACKKMLIDLDDPTYYNTLFEGFSSGRVRVSLRADKYNRDVLANFMIKRLGDIDLSRTVADFGNAPTIALDGALETDNMPAAVVGGTYPVFAATAADGEGMTCDVQTSVYHTNNGISGRTDVAVTDGRFVTAKAGEYHIVYTATDRGGVTATKTVKVRTQENIAAPTVTPQIALSVTAGEETDLTAYEATGDGVAVDVLVNGAPAENPSAYVFERSGENTVTYSVTDIRGQTATESVTVNVTPRSVPVALSEPQLHDVLIAGCRYYMPSLTAYTIDGDGKKAVDTVCVVTDNRGSKTVKSGEVYIPAVANNGDEITVAYKSGETTVYQTDIMCIKAYAVSNGRKRIQIENYFVSNGFGYTKNNDSMTCTVADTQNAEFTFARKLPAEGFSVMLGTIPEKSAYSSINVMLYEPESGVSVSFAIDCDIDESPDGYVRKAGYVSVGSGVNRTRISMPALYIRDGGTVTGMYKEGTWVFNRDYTIRISRDDQGRPFNGFGDAEVYCSVSLTDAKQGAAFNVHSICGQTVSANPLDGIAPVIKVYGDYGGDKAVGDSLVVLKATAFDILDAMTTLSVTVTAPDGSPVSSADGIKLVNVPCDREYRFTAETFGTYLVTYSAYDTLGGNMSQFAYNYAVRDNTAPVITLATDAPTSGKVGTAFVIPDITVSDDVTAADKIIVHKSVIAPNFDNVYMKGNAFVPQYAGVYTVVITAIDERGNASVLSFDVEVAA